MDQIPVDLLDGGKLTIALAILFWGLAKGWIAARPHVQSLLDTIKYQREREVIRDENQAKMAEAMGRMADVLDEFRRASEETRK